jgi:D-glycero-alpha-D-manno-heptose-7-phosphate kinase
VSERLLVAFSGRSHVSSRVNRGWVAGFLSGESRAGWLEANEIVRGLAEAIRNKEWDRCARLLREEMAIRRVITPDALIPLTARLIELAEKAGCGARFTGAGCGGSVWALGDKARIQSLREVWSDCLRPVRGAQLLGCNVDPKGVE